MNLNPFRHKDLPSLGNVEREVVDEFRRLETFTESLILQLASWTASDIAYDPTSDPLTAETDVQAAMEDHAAALDLHEGAGGTTRHPVFTTAVEGFVPAPGSLVDASAYFLAANGSWIGHRTVGGTSEHAVFTTSVAGFVPAPSTATGKYLKDNGTWELHKGVGGTSEHPVFTTSVPGFVPAPSTATGKFLLDGATWVAHRAVGGTSEHPVFTTSAAGFVPASTSTTGKVLYDSGWGAAPSSPSFGWGEAYTSSNLDWTVSTTSYYDISQSGLHSSGILVNVVRSNGQLACSGISGTIRARATVTINVVLDYGSVAIDTIFRLRFRNLTASVNFGGGNLTTSFGPASEKGHHSLSLSTVGSLSNSQYIVPQFQWTTTGGGAPSLDLRINSVVFTLEPVGV